MTRPTSYSEEEEKMIVELASRGMSSSEIERVLSTRGSKVHARTIRRVIRSTKTVDARMCGCDQLHENSAQPSAQSTSRPVVIGDDEIEIRMLAHLNRCLKDNEIDEVMVSLRALILYREEKRKNAPVVPPDPEDNPDMQAAAEACKAKLLDYVARARSGTLHA